MDLAVLWAFIIAFAVIAYVILDGFDLGTGILFPLLGRHENRDTAMNTVAPIWDGNETWLVLGGGGLFAVFPLAYAIIMPAIYAPVIAMLLALIFRGVAFEFRFKTVRGRWMWDVSFFVGSIVAAFSQGVALGTLVQGIDIDGRAYAGGWFDWLTPFSLMTGVAVVVGYALLGATWLVMKTEGELHDIARRYAWISAVGTMVLIGVVSLWMPFMEDQFYLRWFTFPQIFYVAPVPILVALATFSLFQSLATGKEIRPFLSALAIFVLSFAGLGITFYPDIIPPHVTIWEAAAPESSLMFLLVGATVLIPLILAYTGYSYWVFRGKVREGEGYHH
ncbi:MAG: cytochrome d ubiquinol oxidase subunit II [Aurantimonas coralicida]|mgnify:FL=1|jgi:cytochrome bd ubiquinol oxidase subunit II|uniref:cytochrome d ubiquinol oxidase subunit II n=1 Tax=Aurantimonas TaxID=182269 RepID=UPI00040DE364|nr:MULTISPECIES: cytochrome d ubiquinol oxidase subunit II [Aurantimonas]MBC6718033.1 cytochrome d ubiquinol oxidase subunit II [Aurantimonas sp. DM33-3]MCC4296190.1 cytochrome d ubiquinol oxidase subunit II [Aurantimonas coralicida]MCD1643908.1 cytochrome d ubiquinol oxidase subunit II [Aurantimonas coralicida]MDE0924291.1 cytochrome d ubiquinol oxidase subunit II [Aurantimonas coralicida]